MSSTLLKSFLVWETIVLLVLDMNSEEIAARIKESIEELVTDYDNDSWSCLTESDATSKLYSVILRRIGSSGIAVHAELRPFSPGLGNEPQDWIIKDRKKPEWGKQKQANDGAVVDLVVIDGNRSFQDEARDKALRDQNKERKTKLRSRGLEPTKNSLRLRYWRMLSYPVKAFKAAIEIKIRVSGNMSKIKSDIKKLTKIQEKNSDCGLYLVVLDCEADEKKLHKIREFATNFKGRVTIFTSLGRR